MEHLRDPQLEGLEFEAVYRTDVYAQQRGLEHALHELYRPPLNKIGAISAANPNRQTYINAASEFLSSVPNGLL
jgi:hypothetical protein